MSMPYVDDDLDEDLRPDTVEGFENEGSDIALDMAAGDIVIADGEPELIDGEEALRQWIEKVFSTRAYVYDIYELEEPSEISDEDPEDTDDYDDEEDEVYGSKAKEIMMDPDMPRGLKMANIQQDIEEVLLRHPDIISLSDFEFEANGVNLTVYFNVQSIYGEQRQEVIIDVQNGE